VINGKSVLAVVPARGGSKGLPGKNLRRVGGKSLVALAGEVAAEVSMIDRRIVSTDSEEIAEEARKADLDVPFMRPLHLSGCQVADWPVLTHALAATEQIDRKVYDIVVMLQPTSPLRTAADVFRTIRMLVDGQWDAVWTVSQTDSKAHPLKQLTVQDGVLDYWEQRGSQIVARQQLEPVYHRNGVAYAITRNCLVAQGTLKGARTGAYIVPGEHVSIDTEWDLELVELLMKRNSA
jgi:CMP-N,N'-diacetyllegionaminic acid synthase